MIFPAMAFPVLLKSDVSSMMLNNLTNVSSWDFYLSSYVSITQMEQSVQSTKIILLRNFCRLRSPNLGASCFIVSLISCCQNRKASGSIF